MAAQKTPKTLSTEMFCIFECLLTQNPTNQGSQLSLNYLINYSKTGGSRELHGSYPPKRWGNFNFESSNHWREEFFFIIWGGGGGGIDNGNQRGGHNSGQNNYHNITFFFKEK